MNIRITLNTENAAFEDSPDSEVARILHKLADWFETDPAGILDGDRVPLFDVNGNKVGLAIVDNGEG